MRPRRGLTRSFDDDARASLGDGVGETNRTDPSLTVHLSLPVRNCAQSEFKKEREKALKADAGNKTTWNALFMRADTVAAAVAARFGAWHWRPSPLKPLRVNPTPPFSSPGGCSGEMCGIRLSSPQNASLRTPLYEGACGLHGASRSGPNRGGPR